MTSDAEFGQSEYEMTVSPQEDGSYELTATGDPVAFGFKSIVSKTTNAAYKGGSSDTDLQDGTIDYIVRYLRDVNLKGELDKDDVWYGYNNDNTFDAPKEVGKCQLEEHDWLGLGRRRRPRRPCRRHRRPVRDRPAGLRRPVRLRGEQR